MLYEVITVWCRRGLGDQYPELFRNELSDKAEELIVTNAQRRYSVVVMPFVNLSGRKNAGRR